MKSSTKNSGESLRSYGTKPCGQPAGPRRPLARCTQPGSTQEGAAAFVCACGVGTCAADRAMAYAQHRRAAPRKKISLHVPHFRSICPGCWFVHTGMQTCPRGQGILNCVLIMRGSAARARRLQRATRRAAGRAKNGNRPLPQEGSREGRSEGKPEGRPEGSTGPGGSREVGKQDPRRGPNYYRRRVLF